MVPFDTTIRLSDLFLVGGGILAFIKVFMGLQSILKDHEKRITLVEDRTEDHQTWLIRNRLDQQPPLGRRKYDRAPAEGSD